MERRLSTTTQSFEKLRTNGCIYVDKTRYINELMNLGDQFFLSRPRRFGKSLFISTLEAFFLGKKDLFRGLDIEKTENAKGEEAWTEFPVVSFYLSGGEFSSRNGLRDRLNATLNECIKKYNLTGNYSVEGETLAVRFYNLISNLYHKMGKRQVVVLVDEYDNPLLKADSIEMETANRQLYKEFFGVLKDQDQYLKFVFFTGVTKFSQVSIFSDLNQLKDISLLDQFSGICGFTEEEMTSTYGPEIHELALAQGMSDQECLAELRKMYDGYHFSKNADGVYNPYSLINAFADKDFNNYWFESATPGFLIKKLQESSFTPEDFADGVEATVDEIRDYRTDNSNPVPLFYQSGYLTIDRYNRRFRSLELKFPNVEVKYGFLNSLIPYVFGRRDDDKPSFSARTMVSSLEKGKTDSLHDQLYALFASAPYMTTDATKYEEVWRNQIYLVFAVLGQYVNCEQHTSRGRSDCVIETSDYIYLFEFKVDSNADDAIAQIEKMDYAGKYKSEAREVIKIGADFSSKERNIDDWKVVE